MARSIRLYFYILCCLSFACSFAEALPNKKVVRSSIRFPLQFQKPSLLLKAEAHFQLREFDKVIQICLEALRAKDWKANPEYTITIHNLLGAAYIRIRSFDKALSILNDGLKMATTSFPANHYLVGDSNFQLGVYYDQLGHAQESISHHSKALDIRLRNFGSGHLKVAESYVGLGEVYFYTVNDIRKAQGFFEKAVQIREAKLNYDDFELYISYFYLAQVSNKFGDNDKALAFAFKALSVINSKHEYRAYLERCYSLLGEIYYSQTEFSKAIEFLEKAVLQSIADNGPSNYSLIKRYTHLGAAYGELNQIPKAIYYFQKSLGIHALHHHHDNALKAENFLHLGRIFLKAENFDSARYYLQSHLTLQLIDNGPGHMKTSDAYAHLAKLFQEFKYPDSAGVYIQKALSAAIDNFDEKDLLVNPGAKEIRDRYDLFELFGDKGTILVDLFHASPQNRKTLIAALDCFKIADTLMQLSKNNYQQEGSKLFFADHYHNIYEKAIQTSYLLFEMTNDAKYVADAFSFMEKSKAFLLAEALIKAEVFTQVGLPDSIREMERSLNSAMAAYRTQLESIHEKSNSEEIQQRIQSQIFDISQKQERLLDTIASLYPRYFQIKYQKVSSLGDIRNFAKKNNSTILEYFWGEEKIYLLAISANDLVFEEVTGVDSLTNSVVQYFRYLHQVPSWKEDNSAFENFLKNAHDIYSNLVSPVMETEGHNKIIIIRDGPLLLVPFESLLASKGNYASHNYQQLDYLIRHNTLSYAHSADLLLRSSLRIKSKSTENKVLAFSYSQINPTENLLGNRSINELPGAAKEIQAISEILPGSFFLGDEATEQKFKSHASEFDILHLAVHGNSDPEKQFSGSLFFKGSQDQQEDGELHVYELYDLSLKARLTVLSACESGVGKFFRGEGVFSIARGFAYAGCPSTVMTLWSISDMASATIMADFYRQLNHGENIDVALRRAKLNYLENTDPQLAHPAYWAAFIPTGSMEAVIVTRFPSSMKWIIMAVAFIFLAWFVFKNRYYKRHQTHHAKQQV